ncbi:MAG TPA: 50S ribosomal protein L22 [Chloroflexia bacterium]|nr:50S ribosomal protein L22 [Chloroflexia bacterium]
MEVRATAKFIRSSPRKVRIVMDVVRGKSVKEAVAILTFMPQAAARDVAAVVKSAAANAENNYQMAPDDLMITSIYANEGPTFKRYRAKARGQGTTILKRTSHITVVVDEREGI